MSTTAVTWHTSKMQHVFVRSVIAVLHGFRQKYKKSLRLTYKSEHSDVSSDDVSPAHNRSNYDLKLIVA